MSTFILVLGFWLFFCACAVAESAIRTAAIRSVCRLEGNKKSSSPEMNEIELILDAGVAAVEGLWIKSSTLDLGIVLCKLQHQVIALGTKIIYNNYMSGLMQTPIN